MDPELGEAASQGLSWPMDASTPGAALAAEQAGWPRADAANQTQMCRALLADTREGNILQPSPWARSCCLQ